jgi:DNA-binding NtrC family response regulator
MLAIARATERQQDPQRRILVVDDDVGVRVALELALAQNLPDVDVTMAIDAKDAMKKMGRQAPHILLTDENMPGLYGTDLIAWTRVNHPATFCLLMSGAVDGRLRRSAAALGVDLIEKTFVLGDLAFTVRALVDAHPG